MRKALQSGPFVLFTGVVEGVVAPIRFGVCQMRILRAPERQKGVAVGRSVRSVVAAWGRLAFGRGGRAAEYQVSLPAETIDGVCPRFAEPGCDLPQLHRNVAKCGRTLA
jgi:hypothetical protein